MKTPKLLLTLPLLVVGLKAQEADTLTQAIQDGKPTIDARLRFENAEQDGREESDAFTGRIRLGYETGSFAGLKAFVEFEGNTALNDEDDFNPYPQAGKTVIADPDTAELNRAYLSWSYDNTTINAGRQRIILDNSRFIGNVGWRQNEQTYDGVSLTTKALGDITLSYNWIDQVNRIFGSDAPVGGWERLHTNAHAVNAAYTGLGIGKVSVYNYYLDIENSAGNSSNTYGISLSGSTPVGAAEDYSLAYYSEIAEQSDAADNPTDYDATYYHLSATLSRSPVSIGLGYEVLGSDDGVASFKTPLATLHKFNGFADVFLNTPAAGLEDFYVVGKYQGFSNTTLALFYHDFESDEGSTDLGEEWDFVIGYKFNGNWSGTAKYADYNQGDATSPADIQRLSFQVDYKF